MKRRHLRSPYLLWISEGGSKRTTQASTYREGPWRLCMRSFGTIVRLQRQWADRPSSDAGRACICWLFFLSLGISSNQEVGRRYWCRLHPAALTWNAAKGTAGTNNSTRNVLETRNEAARYVDQ